jgi:hypothetical protein
VILSMAHMKHVTAALLGDSALREAQKDL